MKATITYTLSNKGQKAALCAGTPAQTKQTLEVDVGPEDLDGFFVDENGSVFASLGSLPLFGGVAKSTGYAADVPLTPTEAVAVRRQQMTDQQKETDAKAAEWRAEAVAYLAGGDVPPSTRCYPDGSGGTPFGVTQEEKQAVHDEVAKRQAAKVARVCAEWRAVAADYLAGGTRQPYLPDKYGSPVPKGITKEEEGAARAEADRRETAVAEKRKAVLAAVLAEQAPDRLAQFMAGAMSDDDVTRLVVRHTIAPLETALPPDLFSRYRQLQPGEITHTDDCQDDSETTADAPTMTVYPHVVWDHQQKVLAAIAGVSDATMTVHKHTMSCDACSKDVSRWAIHVRRSSPLIKEGSVVLRLAVPDSE